MKRFGIKIKKIHWWSYTNEAPPSGTKLRTYGKTFIRRYLRRHLNQVSKELD